MNERIHGHLVSHLGNHSVYSELLKSWLAVLEENSPVLLLSAVDIYFCGIYGVIYTHLLIQEISPSKILPSTSPPTLK